MRWYHRGEQAQLPAHLGNPLLIHRAPRWLNHPDADIRGVALHTLAGTVRTAMSEHSVNSPEGRKWLPWFRRIFDEGLDSPPERALFPALMARRVLPGAGHFLPREKPEAVSTAMLELLAATK